MVEGRFEPAGGGLRLVWRFWAVGGRAHAGMCWYIASEAASRAPGRRGGSRTQFAQLSVMQQAAVFGGAAPAGPREAGTLKDESDAGTYSDRKRRGGSGKRGAFTRLGRLTPSPLDFWQNCLFSGASCPLPPVRATLGTDQAQAVFSGQRRSLQESGKAPRAPTPDPQTPRGTTPHQEPLQGSLALARKQGLP